MVLQTYGSRVAGNAGCESAGWAEHDPFGSKTRKPTCGTSAFSVNFRVTTFFDVAYVGNARNATVH